MKVDRNCTVTITAQLGHALPISMGDLIDTIRDEVITAIKDDPHLATAVAAAVAAHLTASVRPT